MRREKGRRRKQANAPRRRRDRANWSRLIAMLLIAGALAGACTGIVWLWNRAQRFRAPVERALAMMQEQRFDDAIAEWEKARQARPDDPAPLRGLAECFKAKGQYATAAAWATQAIGHGPSPAARVLAGQIELAAAGPWDATSSPAQGITHEQRLHLAKAAEHAASALDADGASGPAHRVLAEVAARLGDRAKAREHVARALELGSDSADTHLLAADLLARDGKTREALGHARKAVEALDTPEVAGDERFELLRALARAARIATALKLADEAVGLWTRYLDLKGDRGKGHVGLLIAKLHKGDLTEAIEEGSKAMRAMAADEKSWDLHYYRGLAYLGMKRYDYAVQDFRTAIGIRDDAEARYGLGMALLPTEESGMARDAFVQALGLDPRHMGARAELAKLLEADGAIGKALDLWREGVEAARGTHSVANVSPPERAPLDASAAFALKHGRVAEAEAAFRSLLELEPTAPRALKALCTFYVDQGEPEKGLPVALQGRRSAPEDPEFATLLGRCTAGLGRYEEAAAHFGLAVQMRRESADAYLHWATMHWQAGDATAAEDVFGQGLKAAPSSASLQLAHARFCIATGRADQGVAELRLALDRQPKDLGPRLQLVEHLLSRGDKEAALNVASQGLTLLPDRVDSLKLVARVHRARDEWDSVLGLLSQAERLPGGGPAVLLEQLAAQVHEGVYAAAVELATSAVSRAPGLREQVGLVAAVARFYSGDTAGALEGAGRIVAADPRDADAGWVRSLMALDVGEGAVSAPASRESALPAVALDAWRDLVKVHDAKKKESREEARKLVRLFLTAYVYEQAGWHDTAALQIEDVLKAAPGCLVAHCLLPVLWERAGGRARAIAACQRGIAACKGVSYGQLVLGDLLLLEGKVAEARAAYAECSAGEDEPFDARSKLALLAEATGDAAGALAAWRSILRSNPRHVPTANNAAWLLATQMRPDLDEAAAAARGAVDATPQDAAALDPDGWVSYVRGETRRAIQCLEAAAKLAPHRGITLFHLGMAYARHGDADRARTTLQRAVELAPQEPFVDTAQQMLRKLR